MRYSAEGLNYLGAIALIENLRDAGIEANVSTGGVGIWCETQKQVDIASRICSSHGTKLEQGFTRSQYQFPV